MITSLCYDCLISIDTDQIIIKRAIKKCITQVASQNHALLFFLIYGSIPHAFRRSTIHFRGVAQPGSVLAWGASGRRFKSFRPDQLNQ